jgi:hypothetical protein
VSAEQAARPRARIVHKAAGRVRVRIEKPYRSEELAERVRTRLEDHPSVESVQTNVRTGSVLVTGGHGDALRAALNEAVEIIEEAGPEGVREAGMETLVTLVKGVDARLGGASGGRLSLRWLVPAAFVGVGIRQLIREGLGVGAVPWYVLIYYGVDSFLKLYPQYAPRAADSVGSSSRGPSSARTRRDPARPHLDVVRDE